MNENVVVDSDGPIQTDGILLDQNDGAQELPVVLKQEETTLEVVGVEYIDDHCNSLVLFSDMSLEQETDSYLDTPDDVKEVDHFLRWGAELLLRFDREASASESMMQSAIVNIAIQGGKIALKLKTQVKSLGLKWGKWSKQNLPLIDERKLQRWIQVAERQDSHKYGFTGLVRLLKLVSATKTSGSDDPIGDVLSLYGIDISSPILQLEDLAAFNAQVDAAIDHMGLMKAGIHNVELDAVKSFNASSGRVGGAMLAKMRAHHGKGGDVNSYLRNPEQFDKQKSSGGSHRSSPTKVVTAASCNVLIGQLIESLDKLMQDDASVANLDQSLIEKLEDRILTIKSINL